MHAALQQAPRGALTVHARIQQLACRIAPRRTRWHRSLSSSGPAQLPRERFASLVLHAKNSRAMQELMAQRQEEKEEEEGVPVGEAYPHVGAPAEPGLPRRPACWFCG